MYSCCSSDLWLYSLEKCKVAQPVHINSGLTDTFECLHSKEAKNSCDCSPFITLHLDLVNYPCSYVVRSKLSEIVSSLLCANSPSVIQVSDKSFGVFLSSFSQYPVGFCHMQKETHKKAGIPVHVKMAAVSHPRIKVLL